MSGTRDTRNDTGEAGAQAPASLASGRSDPVGALYARRDEPVFRIVLWPHRSLGAKGSGIVIALAATGLSLPLFGLLGSRAAWGMLPFLVAVLLALYWAFRRSHADARLSEELRLWPDLITVERHDPGGGVRRWHANPFWVEIRLRDDAPIEKYLTLRGNGREIEVGAFLAPWEREALYRDLLDAFARARALTAGGRPEPAGNR